MKRAGVAILALVFAQGLNAEPPPSDSEWPVQPVSGDNDGKVVTAERLVRQFPNSANALRQLASARFQAGDRAGTLDALTRLSAMGFALRPATYDGLVSVIGQSAADAFKAGRTELVRPIEISRSFIEIPGEVKLSEGFAYDPKSKRLFAGSVVARSLYQVIGGKVEQVPVGPMGSPFAMVVDAKRKAAWVGTGRVEQTPAAQMAFTGLIAFSLKQGAERIRVAAPSAKALNDLAVAADGTVYASDSAGGGVYRLKPGAEAIDLLVAPGRLQSPQGIAIDPVRDRLYVSDYLRGIAIVDLASGRIGQLSAPATAMLDGTDGLLWDGDGLIAIQNGVQPNRIVRLSLNPNGSAVTTLTVLEQAHSAWGEPTVGQRIEGGLLYASDPQWDRFAAGGAMKGEEPLRPNIIRFLPLPDPPKPKRARRS